jgi:hypothetical protein
VTREPQTAVLVSLVTRAATQDAGPPKTARLLAIRSPLGVVVVSARTVL